MPTYLLTLELTRVQFSNGSPPAGETIDSVNLRDVPEASIELSMDRSDIHRLPDVSHQSRTASSERYMEPGDALPPPRSYVDTRRHMP